MALSVYVHIPYCLQRCRYCDFTTFEQNEILPPRRYVDQLLSEIRSRHARWVDRSLSSIYFGGGTPSLLDSSLIISIVRELANVGFVIEPDCEMTIEINPATMNKKKFEDYLKAGFNRFSVGAQTFDDDLLKMCGRRHSAADTRETLRMLEGHNYSFDLLFALPGQSLSGVKKDLDEVARFTPPHLSAYCLTVPESHPMSRGRAPEDEQIEMFEEIERRLASIDLLKYEISNFSRPGLESRHNLVYWRDQSFWGIGLSAHSYDRDAGQYGTRFWNTKSLATYAEQSSKSVLPNDQSETLLEHEAMTDFCHMFLRTKLGLEKAAVRNKFREQAARLIETELESLMRDAWLIEPEEGRFVLSGRGEMVSNQVFERLTFLRD